MAAPCVVREVRPRAGEGPTVTAANHGARGRLCAIGHGSNPFGTPTTAARDAEGFADLSPLCVTINQSPKEKSATFELPGLRLVQSLSDPDSLALMKPTLDQVRACLVQVIAQMRLVGIWDIAPAAPHEGPIGAFGQSAGMAFEQWLRHVFVPRVEETLAAGGPWPSRSAVSVQAVREWQMWGNWPEAEPLIEALQRFDALFVD